jgi:hypothetical protein
MIYKPVPGKLNRPPPEDVATHDVHHWALMLLHLTNVPSFILPMTMSLTGIACWNIGTSMMYLRVKDFPVPSSLLINSPLSGRLESWQKLEATASEKNVSLLDNNIHVHDQHSQLVPYLCLAEAWYHSPTRLSLVPDGVKVTAACEIRDLICR